MLVLHSPEHGWRKARCVQCAGEPCPELPALETTDASGFVKVGASVPFDVKAAQAGKD